MLLPPNNNDPIAWSNYFNQEMQNQQMQNELDQLRAQQSSYINTQSSFSQNSFQPNYIPQNTVIRGPSAFQLMLADRYPRLCIALEIVKGLGIFFIMFLLFYMFVPQNMVEMLKCKSIFGALDSTIFGDFRTIGQAIVEQFTSVYTYKPATYNTQVSPDLTQFLR